MRAVFFDLDGTLVELPDDFGAVFESALRDCGVAATDERAEYYTDAFFDYFGENHPSPYRAAMADLRAEFDLAPSAAELADARIDREVAETALRPGVPEALDALRDRGVALGVLTNGANPTQRRKLVHHDIADYFEELVVSGEVGAAKPDPEIFEAATDAIAADEYVFVADDLERDVLPAQEAGFAGVYVTEGATDDPESAGEADAIVESVGEVPDLLG